MNNSFISKLLNSSTNHHINNNIYGRTRMNYQNITKIVLFSQKSYKNAGKNHIFIVTIRNFLLLRIKTYIELRIFYYIYIGKS